MSQRTSRPYLRHKLESRYQVMKNNEINHDCRCSIVSKMVRNFEYAKSFIGKGGQHIN